MNRLKTLILVITLLPAACFAQFSISGRVLNQADKKPVENASVFLNNASVGDKTGTDGVFTLRNARPGKYELIVSIVGFDTYRQNIMVNNNNITLPAIEISPKTIALKEVNIKPVVDPNRARNYEWFKAEFLGVSDFANQCTILNPEMLDIGYDENTSILTASSADFLVIENQALGYRIKYLLAKFRLDKGFTSKYHLDYEGSVQFEEMKGTSSDQRHWSEHRQQVYANSSMHFLRAVINNRITEEGFRALRVTRYLNPERPADTLIEAKIALFKKLKSDGSNQRDSLSFWTKKAKLPKTLEKLIPGPLHKSDILKPTDQQGMFALWPGGDNDALYISYNKDHRFYVGNHPQNLDDPENKENTRIDFDTRYAMFDRNGWPAPNSLIYSGAWGRSRIAELLPIDYDAPVIAGVAEDSTAADKLITKLNGFNTTHRTEKAYLQFDKPYYAAGDTIYFKAYVTAGERHELSNISGLLHVDLINTKNKIDQSINLQIDSGLAWGDFALPDSLPKGNYRVRAYTQWMRNYGDDNNFSRTIAIGSTTKTKIPENANPAKPAGQPDIQFLPESGSLVAGIRAKVAFKVIGTDGLGINVRGIVLDNNNNEICSFASTHLGMGYFYLTPMAGKTYKAKLNYPGGVQNTVDLPVPVANGVVLSINNDSIPNAAVRIEANKTFFQQNRGKNYVLLIYDGGTATHVNCALDSTVVTLNILKRHMRSGIATVTLFSPEGLPLCERLLFIQSYDQLSLALTADKTSYAPRGVVNIRLNANTRAGDGAAGHFSVSVVDENKVPVDENTENTILTDLLLTSGLKGYVEQPNYYFSDTSASAGKNLDLLLLTQGYRHFTWKQVMDNNPLPLTYQPEKGIEISGRVNNLFGNPVANGTVNLLPQKSKGILSTVTDNKGMFHFKDLVFTDTVHFMLSAINVKGRNSTKLTYLGEQSAPVLAIKQTRNSVTDMAMALYINNDKRQQEELVKFGHLKGIMLREVKIKDKKPDNQYRTQSIAGAGNADQVMHAEEIEKIQGTLVTSLNGRLRGVTFASCPSCGIGEQVPVLASNIMSTMPNHPPNAMLVIIDGAEMSPESINFYSPNDIETVEVLKYASTAAYGMQGGDGVLIITTKQNRGLAAKDIASIGVLPITPMGFYKAREFYSPKYDHPETNHKQNDFRSTIYWQPELVTDQDGKASFQFYNADSPGIYKVVVEGIDNKGNLGRIVYRYSVSD